jgi:anti-sigma factor (TIGR02949 family)
MSEEPLCCRDAVQFLLQYLDGELPADQRARFELHLRSCPPCVDYLESYRETIRLGKACSEQEAPLPEKLREGILRALRDLKP